MITCQDRPGLLLSCSADFCRLAEQAPCIFPYILPIDGMLYRLLREDESSTSSL